MTYQFRLSLSFVKSYISISKFECLQEVFVKIFLNYDRKTMTVSTLAKGEKFSSQLKLLCVSTMETSQWKHFLIHILPKVSKVLGTLTVSKSKNQFISEDLRIKIMKIKN